ncbi:hypothetical protein X801_06975 [Opisthorchis viverrini]|uniref:Uncharacterized protein n=1 Tax=Opisthorchis viverrini TaxID=6198 RepID=A0A1S8WRR0_OPIVI|nr:hypothetical protein X801_06975 [Opisthorchis viverrini]
MVEDNPLLNKVDILEDSVQIEHTDPVPERAKEFVTSSTIHLDSRRKSSAHLQSRAQSEERKTGQSRPSTTPSTPEHARRNSHLSAGQISDINAPMDQTEPRVPSVGQLRDYFNSLGQTNSTSNAIQNGPPLRKLSYTLPRKSIQVLSVNTDLGDAPLEHNTSVEELRQMFERGEVNKRLTRGQSLEKVTSPGRDLSRNSMSKSVEFFCRPPKFRTPSPISHSKLPTPPPLPLPPSPELIDTHFNRTASSSIRCRGRHGSRRNFVTQMKQSAQPILSMHLPFRSRSLALDRGTSDFPPKGTRYRAGSITQRSLSPVEPPSGNPQRYKNTGMCTMQSGMAAYRPALRQTDSGKRDKAIQSNNRSLIPINSKGELIHVQPSDTDGVFVRSAVVYERVPNALEQNAPKQFVTTYVISDGPYPSRSTIQATNFWVAETALQDAKKDGIITPYRTQALTRTGSEQSVNQRSGARSQTRETQVSMPRTYPSSSGSNRIAARPRSVPIGPKVHQQVPKTPSPCGQPPALPTPPPAEIHPYILRCSSMNTSPNRVPYTWLPTKDSSVQCNRPAQYYPSPTRSWSVKSLSPPPYRTPILSSLQGQKNPSVKREKPMQSNIRRTQSMRLTTSGQSLSGEDKKRLALVPKRYRPQTGVYRSESERIREASERRRWMQKAESVNRERQAYHELRGSWSPPHIRSAARYVPNDLEENTEREIRDRVRRRKPLSPVPPLFTRVFVEDCGTQTPAYKVNEAVQCSYSPQPTRDIPSPFHVNDGVDTTPITPGFAEKRAYFEQLIRTNKLLARCSFCSDCYHCPPGQTPHHSTYASWDSDLNAIESVSMRPHSTQTEDYNPKYRKVENYQHVSSLSDPRNYTDPYRPSYGTFNGSYEPSQTGPQQYSSSLYLASKPVRSARWDTMYRDYDPRQSTGCESCSIDHEYYAKAQNAMPKVAPNPPKKEYNYNTHYPSWVTTTSNDYRPQSHAELVHSPTLTTYPTQNTTKYLTRYEYPVTGGFHSPPCRFYTTTTSKPGSIESLNDRCETAEVSTATTAADLAAYRGRVKQIVCELNEREYNNAYKSSQEDLHQVAILRRPYHYALD